MAEAGSGISRSPKPPASARLCGKPVLVGVPPFRRKRRRWLRRPFGAGKPGNGLVMDDRENRAHVTELIRAGRISMLTTMTDDGRHVSRPMGLQEAEFDGDLWFFAFSDSDKVAQIRRNPQVNVSFTTKEDAWVSVAGSAEVVDDRAKAAQLWNPFLKVWFPDGLDTPTLTLIRVHAESAEYWDAPHGKAITLIQYGAAALLHKQPPEGDNETVTFPPTSDTAP